ncbi:MAG TPA: DsbA family protein [Solirubrobacteraceae bacterium]
MAPEQPVFYYDLGDPECYLVGERVSSELAVVPEWEPILARRLGLSVPDAEPAGLRERAAQQGLQPLRWPPVWPPDTEQAMLAATYAKHIGRAVAYSLAAFRQAFAGGRDLGDEGTVLIAAAACEMHPTALLKGMALRSVGAGLARAGERAREAGVTALPAIAMAGAVFTGRDCLEQANRWLASPVGGR